MTWKYSKTIKAILFAKDGTLIDFDKTWAATNRKGAITAAGGDPQLTDILLDACGMTPLTGKTRADSILLRPMPTRLPSTWWRMAARSSMESCLICSIKFSSTARNFRGRCVIWTVCWTGSAGWSEARHRLQ